ncbi:MAG: cytochrome c [Pseudomonadota bacterium]|nr:cytochrome c [Pseudomonadota bacterium]
MRIVVAALVFASGAAAAQPQTLPGKAKAQMCATCHGPLGISVTPDAPHLAGQPRFYLMEQLKAFRSGKRAHEVMNVVAKPLTDANIEALADWYASLVVEAREKR